MLRKGCITALLLLGCLSGPAAAQVKLRWQFKQGETFYVEDTSAVKAILKIQGSVTRHELDLTRVSRFTVLTATEEQTVLERKIESVKLNGPATGQPADTKVIQQLKGATFQLTLDARQQVVRFDGYEALIGRLAKGDEETGKVMRRLFPEQQLQGETAELFSYTLKKPVAPGATWQVKSEVPLIIPAFGTLEVLDTCKLQEPDGEDKGSVTVAVASALTYSPPPAGTDAGQCFKATGGSVKVHEARGTVQFDATKGRVIRYESYGDFEAAVTVAVADQQGEVRIEHRQTRTLRVLDKSPLPTNPGR